MRPYVIDNRSKAMPAVHAQTGLQRIVIGFPGGIFLHYVIRAVGKSEAPRHAEIVDGGTRIRSARLPDLRKGGVRAVRGENLRRAWLADIKEPEQPVPL